jgi:hypothetical protein
MKDEVKTKLGSACRGLSCSRWVNNDPSWNFDFYLGGDGDFRQVDFSY